MTGWYIYKDGGGFYVCAKPGELSRYSATPEMAALVRELLEAEG